ncbi:hypothetical protein EON80_21195 [bacterium]|nr:MAG: hypothetical protein EON80_21195 [bacterium]
MAFLGTIFRARRGDFNMFLIAALVALLVVPSVTHAVMPPQSCEAVLLWLQNETSAVVATPVASPTALLAISHQKAESPQQASVENYYSVATFHCGQFSIPLSSTPTVEPHIAPVSLPLERHVVARLSGVRTNRRLI